jgi:hypothetical protein
MNQTPPVYLSQHAQARLQQRGIPAWYVDLLVSWGEGRHDGHGAQVFAVTKAVRHRLARELPREEYVMAERYFGVYAVVSGGGTLITVAHRQGRAHLH